MNFSRGDLFERWRTHDLGAWRPKLYAELRPAQEAKVWQFIEQNYLGRYDTFLRLEPQSEGTGVWEIAFPGAVERARPCSLEALALPALLANRVREWQAWYTSDAIGCGCGGFDWERFDEAGRALAHSVKKAVGARTYVEYDRFCEIILADGEPVELPVPAPLARLIQSS